MRRLLVSQVIKGEEQAGGPGMQQLSLLKTAYAHRGSQRISEWHETGTYVLSSGEVCDEKPHMPAVDGSLLTKAVSERFISAAICCIMSSAMAYSSMQTAAGLPENLFVVKASACTNFCMT